MIADGTLIATPDGARPAETLRPGDEVMVLADGPPSPRPLRWVGRREVDLARHPSPARAAPVRIAAAALAPETPSRDLLLSPDHPVLIDGLLFPARALANGATVARLIAPARVGYVSLELGRPGLLLAEGAAVSSYLDVGDRGEVAGRRGGAPDLTAPPSATAIETWARRAGMAPRLDLASILSAHRPLVARARAMGWSISDDPALAVLADDAPAPLVRFSIGHYQARLPAGARLVRLVSRSFVPAEHDPAIQDSRRLGIAVSAARLRGRSIAAGAFGRGWHLSEPDWRWTDGDARLTLRPLEAPASLEIRIVPGAPAGYWVPPP